jgi:hypothetical protein
MSLKRPAMCCRPSPSWNTFRAFRAFVSIAETPG